MTPTRRALALSLYTLIAVFAFFPVLPHVAGAAATSSDETTTAAATPPKADYRFDNVRTSSVGSAPGVKDVTNFSNNTFFINDSVENHPQPVLGFPGGTGVEIHPTTGVIPGNTYTIAMLVRMESVSGKQRLVDFSRGSSGAGWFINNGRLSFVQSSLGGSGNPAGAFLNSNAYVQFVLTRTADGAVKSYINGDLAHTINDNTGATVISNANALRFFIGDTTGGGTDDTAGGRIARLRLYDTPLTETEIEELDRAYDPPTGDLSVQISPPQSEFFIGNEFTYDVTTALANANVPATNVRLTHSVPAGFEVLEVQNARGACAIQSGAYTCELAMLASNASAPVTFRARAVASGEYTMTASVTSDSMDTQPSNNTDNFSISVRSRADLRLTQAVSVPTAARNQEVAFTVTVHNAGPNAATNVRVSNIAPALLTNVSCQTTAGTCAGTNPHTATIPELAAGASAIVTLAGRIHQSALNFAVVSNFAQLQTDTPDPDATNNLAYASLVVRVSVTNGKLTFIASDNSSSDSVHTINPDGTALVDLSNITFTRKFGSDFSPAWSPDGSRYAFSGYTQHRGGVESNGRDIFIAEAGGTGTGGALPARITTTTRHNETNVSWSPDGSRLVFDRALVLDNGTCVGHCHNHIYTMNPDGTGEQQLTTSTKDFDPAWSPDGSRIAFMSERDGNREIYVMNADGSNQTRLTNSPEADQAPAWSPDGSRIVFERLTYTPSYSSDIFTMNPNGSGVVNLTNTAPDGLNTRAEHSPAWSPDGTRISYVVSRYVGGNNSNDNYDYDLYLMNPDGAVKTLIYTHPHSIYSTAWQPISQNFVVTNTSDSGAGSLRQAMIDADTLNQAARITFQIPGTGVQTLRPATGYAHIETPLFLDATTQTGYAGAPLIEISGNLAPNFTHGFVVRQGSLIKGFAINRFNGVGIFLLHNGNAVQGCYIGTNLDGTAAAPNSQAGILANNLANQIGGTSALTRNVISGNSGAGIASGVGGVAINSWSSRMTIRGNYIGTDRTGTQPIPNGSIGIALSLQPAIVGGTEAGAGNLIANNGSHGIVVTGRYKTIIGNSITANGGLGISLNGNSFTPVPNDDGDPDTGANNLQNSPVIASAQISNGVTVISGTINTRIAENPTFFSDRNKITLHFYSSPACDSSGSGEGRTYVGSTVLYLSADVSTENFRFVPGAQIPLNHIITATATNGLGETSEFSPCRPLTAGTQMAKITGYARSRRNNQPIGDVEMRLTGAQTAIAHTDAQGNFEFANLPLGGSYTVTPSRAGFSFAPVALTVERLTGDALVGFEGDISGDPQTTSLDSSGDTWVQGAAEFRDANYGTSTELQVKRTLNPGAGRGRRAFLKFDTTYNVTGEVRSAKLRVFARLTTNGLAPTQMIAQKVTDTAWEQIAMTWNNQSNVASPTALASITVAGTTGAWYEFDLTQFVKAERAAGRPIVAIRLINMQPTGTSGASYTAINSSDAEQNRPELVIEHQ